MNRHTVTVCTGREYHRISLYASSAALAILDGEDILRPYMPKVAHVATKVRCK